MQGPGRGSRLRRLPVKSVDFRGNSTPGHENRIVGRQPYVSVYVRRPRDTFQAQEPLDLPISDRDAIDGPILKPAIVKVDVPAVSRPHLESGAADGRNRGPLLSTEIEQRQILAIRRNCHDVTPVRRPARRRYPVRSFHLGGLMRLQTVDVD